MVGRPILLLLLVGAAHARPFGGRKKAAAQCELNQINVLRQLHLKTKGHNWFHTWDLRGDPCINEWYGVQCDRKGNVRLLELPSNNLVGSLPQQFGQLTKLRTLNLVQNQLTGQLPASFTSLTLLKAIFISGNHFVGLFPASVGGFRHLTSLDISKNDFDAPLPAVIEALPQRGVRLAMDSYKVSSESSSTA